MASFHLPASLAVLRELVVRRWDENAVIVEMINPHVSSYLVPYNIMEVCLQW